MVSLRLKKRETIPAPYVAQQSKSFDGDDGLWSTFAISVGTPPQSFRVLPATIDPMVTLPFPEGCMGGLKTVDDCGDRRGANSNNGVVSRGFAYTNSTSYLFFGAYTEFNGQSAYSDASGNFGNDTIILPTQNSNQNITLPEQVVAGLVNADFWLGSFGLGNTLTTYKSNGFSAPSLLSYMKSQSLIPSLSYGYHAGQHYNSILGSLVLGGYDTSKFSSDVAITAIDQSPAIQRLNINVQSLLAQNGGNGQFPLLSPITMSIDSSINQIWLPQDACDVVASAFGLTYDAEKAWYLINDTMHQTLKTNNAYLKFVLGGTGSSRTINIVLNYNALDLQVGIPWYNSSINYFPMKRATNSSQYILGRAFLQEAYLAVDWERGNFSLGQVSKTSTASSILAITPPATTSSNTASSSPSSSGNPTSTPVPSPDGIGSGAIAGIVIAVLVIAAAAGLFFFFKRRSKNRRRVLSQGPPPAYVDGGTAEFYAGDKPDGDMTELKTAQTHLSELYDSSKPRAELTSDNIAVHEELAQRRELMSTPVAELVGDEAGSELDITSSRGRDSIASGSNTARASIASPHRSSIMSMERARSPLASPPLGSPPLFELE